jgi:hypothetical protein
MDINYLISVLEYHLDRNGVSEAARRGCQYHEDRRVIQRGPAGWHVVDVEPRPDGGFVPSNAAIGEAVRQALRALKSFSTAATETAKPAGRNRPFEEKPAKR